VKCTPEAGIFFVLFGVLSQPAATAPVRRMTYPKVLFGFHAVGVRLKLAPQSVVEIFIDPTRPRGCASL